jgi:UDP-N-acetylglucosamine 3-dehydrogenase
LSERIRVGIAGCGKIARHSHIKGFNSLRGVEVSALYDVDPDKAKECGGGAAPGAKIFADFEEMLDSGIDAVSICTPTVFHHEQAMAALNKGLHVFCEKPMALNLNQAGMMVNASRKSGSVLHINQSLRYNPVYITIGKLVEKGKIGPLQHMRCIRGAKSNPASPGGWSPGAGWFVSKSWGGGVLLDIGIHMADLFSWYGGEVSEIAGDVKNLPGPDGASESAAAVFRFKSGATGVLELKWNLGTGVNMLEVYGTKGMARLGFSDGLVEIIPAGKSPREAEAVEPPKRVKNSFQSFAGAVRGENASGTPGELGRDALALCEAIQKSSDTGRFVKVAKQEKN